MKKEKRERKRQAFLEKSQRRVVKEITLFDRPPGMFLLVNGIVSQVEALTERAPEMVRCVKIRGRWLPYHASMTEVFPERSGDAA